MSFVLAIFSGLIFNYLLKSKMTKGELGAGKTFWFFGVLIMGGLCSIAMVNFVYTISALQNSGLKGTGQALSSIDLFLVPIGAYAYCAFLGVWRSAKSLGFLKKIVARYLSFFLLSCGLTPLFFTLPEFLVFFITLYLFNKYAKRNKTSEVNAGKDL